jgi:hypothetical protein
MSIDPSMPIFVSFNLRNELSAAAVIVVFSSCWVCCKNSLSSLFFFRVYAGASIRMRGSTIAGGRLNGATGTVNMSEALLYFQHLLFSLQLYLS